MVKISIGRNESGQRLDRFLRKYLPGASLSYIYKALRKDVKVNGRRCRQDQVLQEGDQLALYISEEELVRLHPVRKVKQARRQFVVAYEDRHLLIADKPPGLLVHGDRTEKSNHLTNQVIARLIATGEYDPGERTFVPAPVNRIDRNTAGLVIFPKDYETLKVMSRLIRSHTCVRKFYLTIVKGTLDGPLHLTGKMTRDETRNRTLVGEEDGKVMETVAEPLSAEGGYTLCRVEIRTGRTHQIRAQLADAGFPLIGDAKYGDAAVNKALSARFGLTTQFLLAHQLQFSDMPEGYEYLNGVIVTAKLPKRFKEIKEALGL